jgi:hypothetical protein
MSAKLVSLSRFGSGFTMLREWNRKRYKKIRHISDPCTLPMLNILFAALIFIHLASDFL